MSSGAPLEKGTPIREPSQALLCVDSADTEVFEKPIYIGSVLQNPATAGLRIDDKTPAEIQLNKQAPLMFGYMTRVSLTEVCMDWRTPNVNDYNRYLTIALWYTPNNVDDPTILTYFQVKPQQSFYTLPELTRTLEEELNLLTIADIEGLYPAIAGDFTALDWTVRWGFDIGQRGPQTPLPQSDRNDFNCYIALSATREVGFTGDMFFSIVPSNITRTGITGNPYVIGSIPAQQYDLTNMLGLTPTRLSQSQYYVTIQSTGTNMAYTPYVDINSVILTKNQNVQDNDSSFRSGRGKMCRLYLANENIEERIVTATYSTPGNQSSTLVSSFDNSIGCRPFRFRREFQTPKVIQWNTTENIDVIDLEVVDYLGNPIYITKTLDTSGGESGGGNEEFGNQADFQFTVQCSEV